jgi:hypothetical protein
VIQARVDASLDDRVQATRRHAATTARSVVCGDRMAVTFRTGRRAMAVAKALSASNKAVGLAPATLRRNLAERGARFTPPRFLDSPHLHAARPARQDGRQATLVGAGSIRSLRPQSAQRKQARQPSRSVECLQKNRATGRALNECGDTLWCARPAISRLRGGEGMPRRRRGFAITKGSLLVSFLLCFELSLLLTVAALSSPLTEETGGRVASLMVTIVLGRLRWPPSSRQSDERF